MHRVATGIQTVPDSNRSDGGRLDDPETPSESSDGSSSECDTTGDEEGWESGESSASLVVSHPPLTLSSSQTHTNTNHRASLRDTAKSLLSRGEKGRSSHRERNTSVKRSSTFVRSATLDT